MTPAVEYFEWVQQTIIDLPKIAEMIFQSWNSIRSGIKHVITNDMYGVRTFITWCAVIVVVGCSIVLLWRHFFEKEAKEYGCQYTYHFLGSSIAVNIKSGVLLLGTIDRTRAYNFANIRRVEITNDSHWMSLKRHADRNDSPNLGMKIFTGDIDNPEWSIIFARSEVKSKWLEIFQTLQEMQDG